MQQKASSVPFALPSFARLRSADLLIPLVLLLAFALPLLLAFMGVGIRRGKDTPVVINEIAVMPQEGTDGFVELYNNTDAPISVDGWQLGTAAATVTTLQGNIAPHTYLTVSVPTAWSSTADAVLLQRADGTAIDSVNWGDAPANTPISNWNSQAIVAPKPGAAMVRNPQGFDADAASDWRAAPPTANTGSPASLSVGTYRLLFDITNYVSLIAGFLMWGAFVLIGLIAKRFETLTGQRAYWLALLIAPIGLVVYNAIQSYAFFTAGRMTDCKTGWAFSVCQQGWAFVPLFVSAVAVAYVVYHFYGIARRILEV